MCEGGGGDSRIRSPLSSLADRMACREVLNGGFASERWQRVYLSPYPMAHVEGMITPRVQDHHALRCLVEKGGFLDGLFPSAMGSSLVCEFIDFPCAVAFSNSKDKGAVFGAGV